MCGYSCANPVTSIDTSDHFGFETMIYNANDTRCSGEFRCVVINNVPLGNERRGIFTKTKTKTKNDEYKNDNDDSVLPLMPASTYTGTSVVVQIVLKFLTEFYGNETFSITDNTGNTGNTGGRRSPYFWEWKSDVNCVTTKSGSNESFSTTCSNNGRITQYCFSGFNTMHVVENQTVSTIQMSTIQMNESDKYYGSGMLVYQDDGFAVSILLTNVHVDHYRVVEFMKISTSSATIEITTGHLLYKFTQNKNCDYNNSYGGRIHLSKCSVRVFAEELVIGDFLLLLQNNTLVPEKIENIENVMRVGIYSPFPADGNAFFVNNILVSPYSAVNLPVLNYFHFLYAHAIAKI